MDTIKNMLTFFQQYLPISIILRTLSKGNFIFGNSQQKFVINFHYILVYELQIINYCQIH